MLESMEWEELVEWLLRAIIESQKGKNIKIKHINNRSNSETSCAN